MHGRIYVIIEKGLPKEEVEVDLDMIYDLLRYHGIDGLDYSEDFKGDIEDLKRDYGEQVIKKDNVIDLEIIIDKIAKTILKEKERYKKYDSESLNLLTDFLLYDLYDNASRSDFFLVYNEDLVFEIFTYPKLLADYGAFIHNDYPFIKWNKEYILISTLDYHI